MTSGHPSSVERFGQDRRLDQHGRPDACRCRAEPDNRRPAVIDGNKLLGRCLYIKGSAPLHEKGKVRPHHQRVIDRRPVRSRPTFPKGPVTDMPSLKPPRHISALQRQGFPGGRIRRASLTHLRRSDLDLRDCRGADYRVPVRTSHRGQGPCGCIHASSATQGAIRRGRGQRLSPSRPAEKKLWRRPESAPRLPVPSLSFPSFP